ncbi:helix-turn-helix domain-containing protein [Thermopolyspora sp. NPDC052614]|uniref:winged helix-turn-helix transcriptional regulator n=1 Tax=Thermopolyspora sp. NPDC052614 TaxID=3155682 RepID=UPI003439AC8F
MGYGYRISAASAGASPPDGTAAGMALRATTPTPAPAPTPAPTPASAPTPRGVAEAVMHSPDEPTLLPPGRTNSIGYMISVLGDEWNLLIIRCAVFGVTRYCEWKRKLPISDAVLTRRLAGLTELGVFERVEYQSRRYEYRLTRRGRGIWPILLAIYSWEFRWVPVRLHKLPQVIHRGCGELLSVVVVCADCGQPVRPRDVDARLGPSGDWSRWAPESTTRRRAAPPQERPPMMYAQTTALIGNRWSAVILGGAFLGLRRFHEFEQGLSAPPTIVADRLRAFCDIGVFRQVAEGGRADRPAYRLTGKGHAFFPVILMSTDWAERWFHAPEGPAVVVRHPRGGHPFRPRLVCAGCGVTPRATDVDVVGCT